MPRAYVTPSGQKTLCVVHSLGSGAFGEAKAVKDRRGNMFCLKEIFVKVTDDRHRDEALTEVRMMERTCNHPNVIKLYESWFVHNRMCILMEYAPNGSLDKLIERMDAKGERFTVSKVRGFTEELAGAIDFCHAHGIIHRDIKPANILVDQLGSLKLADFGLSRALEPDHLATTFCGSPLYMAPEQYTAENRYSFPADIWAMGCVVFEIMAFRSPWISSGADSRAVIVQRILHGQPDYDVLLKLGYSQRHVDVVRWMLQRTVTKRATASDIVEHLELRAPPSLAQTVHEERATPPPAPAPCPPPLPPPHVANDATVVLAENPDDCGDGGNTLVRRKQIVDDAAAMVHAARVVQRSVRTSVQKRCRMRASPPADDAIKRASGELDRIVTLQNAMRASLNRRRATNLPRALPRRPIAPTTPPVVDYANRKQIVTLQTAMRASLNRRAPRRAVAKPLTGSGGKGTVCSARINELAIPRPSSRVPRAIPGGGLAAARHPHTAGPPLPTLHRHPHLSPRNAWH